MNVQGINSNIKLAQSLTEVSKLPQKIQQQQLGFNKKLLKVNVQAQVQNSQNQSKVDLLA